MSKLIECVPNISEGSDLNKIDKIAKSVLSHEGVKLLILTQEKPQIEQ